MTNRIYPLSCKCRIYGSDSHHTGEICIHCGTRLQHWTPHISKKQAAEDKAIERIMQT